jgi:beta-galactosidase/beta-glucuronidase
MSRVEVEGGLVVNGERILLKGVNYTPTPIGEAPGDSDLFANIDILSRDLPLIQNMGCNLIRIYNLRDSTNLAKYTPFLDMCHAHAIHVAVGMWVPYNADFSERKVREQYSTKFVNMVKAFKDHPAILMWLFGNELNHHIKDHDALFQTVATCKDAVHDIEAAAGVWHPVSTPIGDCKDLEKLIAKYDDCVDIWCTQLYRGATFGRLWTQIERATSKPCLMTEFGCDAYDNNAQKEDEETQASFDVGLFNEILEHRDLCIGGIVFGYVDQFWKGGDKFKQLPGGRKSNGAPDGFSNEAYYGMFSVEKSPDSIDNLKPRLVYFALGELFSAHS